MSLGHHLEDYPRLTRTPWYSLVFILPLVALYEVLAVIVNWDSAAQLRNGADALLRQLLELFGLGMPYVMGAVFAVGVGAAWLWQRRRHGQTPIVGGYLVAMLVESLVWAGFFLVSLNVIDRFLLIAAPGDSALRIAFLAVGAGIYEEAVFRLLLITALATLFHRVLVWPRTLSWGLAAGVAAVLFSLFHFVGPVGEVFSWNSFGYRSVAGIMLGLLFIFRGFGVAAYTHTLYDLIVLGIQTVG